jgi:hypothetical protein
VPLSKKTISRGIQHIGEDFNDQLVEKWGWLFPRFEKMCGNQQAHPSN